MGHALVLNASYEPLHIVTWQRAIQLLFQGKVEVIEEYDREIRTVRLSIKMPAVLRLLTYIPATKRKHIIRFSRANIFARDKHICQYCGSQPSKSQLTLDHVTPIVQGGRKCWENIVTACKPCNQKKGGKTPAQAGMHLRGKPGRPNWLPTSILQVEIKQSPERWQIYFRTDLDPDSSSS